MTAQLDSPARRTKDSQKPTPAAAKARAQAAGHSILENLIWLQLSRQDRLRTTDSQRS